MMLTPELLKSDSRTFEIQRTETEPQATLTLTSLYRTISQVESRGTFTILYTAACTSLGKAGKEAKVSTLSEV